MTTRRAPAAGTVDETLQEAEELAAQGRLVHAIDVLTASNRARRDTRIEERLVALRRRAVEEVEGHGDAPSSWPPAYPDPFPGKDGLVEISARDLSPEVLGGTLTHHGCLLVRGLIDAHAADHLVEVIDRAFTAQDAWRNGASVEETTPWFAPHDPEHRRHTLESVLRQNPQFNRVLVVDSPRAAFEVTEVFREAGIDRLVTDYLRAPPVTVDQKWALRRVDRSNDYAPWHQEASVFGDQHLRSINVWLALSPCGVDSPGFEVLPRRIDRVVQPDAGFGLTPETRDELACGTPLASPCYEPGDAMLIDDLLVHRTKTTPTMIRHRYSIESWHFTPSARPTSPSQVPYLRA